MDVIRYYCIVDIILLALVAIMFALNGAFRDMLRYYVPRHKSKAAIIAVSAPLLAVYWLFERVINGRKGT